MIFLREWIKNWVEEIGRRKAVADVRIREVYDSTASASWSFGTQFESNLWPITTCLIFIDSYQNQIFL